MIKIVSSREQIEIYRNEALREAKNAWRAMAAQTLRIAAGAGDASKAIDCADRFAKAAASCEQLGVPLGDRELREFSNRLACLNDYRPWTREGSRGDFETTRRSDAVNRLVDQAMRHHAGYMDDNMTQVSQTEYRMWESAEDWMRRDT